MNVGLFDEVVVGATLPALMFAFMKRKPFIFASLPSFLTLKHFDINDDLSPFNIFDNGIKTFKTLDSEITTKLSYDELWDQLYWVLSLKGFNLTFGKVVKIIINDNKLIAYRPNTNYFLKFKKLYVFDSEQIQGLEFYENEQTKFEVVDGFLINYYRTHAEYIPSPHDKIKEMWVDRKHVKIRGLITVSEYNDQEIEEFDEITLRFILKDWIEKHFEPNYKGIFRQELTRKKNTIEHIKRHVIRIQPSFSCNRNDVECISLNEKEVLTKFRGYNEELLEFVRIFQNEDASICFRHYSNRTPAI